MDLVQQNGLANNPTFINRVESALVTAAISVTTETISEVQTLQMASGTASGGTLTLAYAGQTSAALQWNSSAGAVQLALAALSNIGTGNVFCSGGSFPGTPIVITFCGTLAGMPLNLISIGTNSLTGSTPVPQVVRTTTGMGALAHSTRLALASKVLANPPNYANLFAQGVASNATVQGDFETASGAFNLAGGVTEATAKSDISFTVNSIFNSYM